MRIRIGRYAGFIVALAVAAATSHAAVLTWDNGAGTLNWNTNDLNWTGSAFTDGGVDDVVFNGSGLGTITNAANMTPLSTTISAAAGNYTFTNGPIDGGILFKSGAGTARFQSSNLFSSVVFNGGTIFAERPATSTSMDRLGGGTMTFSNNATLTTDFLNLGGNVAGIWTNKIVINSGVSATLDAINSGNGHPNFNGYISGAGAVIIGGGGNKLISLNNATNSFSGGLTLVGQLETQTGALGSSLGTGNITFQSGSVTFRNGNIITNNILVTGFSIIAVPGVENVTISGHITGSATLQRQSSGNLTVTGGNSGFTGGWYFNQTVGTRLIFGSQTNLGGGLIQHQGNSPILSITGTNPGTFTNAVSLFGTSSPFFTFEVVDPNATVTWSGLISSTVSNDPLIKDGLGALILNNANTYTDTNFVKAGTLLVGANAPNAANGALGNSTTAVLLGDIAGTTNAALLINGAFTVGRAVTVQAGSSGTATLGGNTADASSFTNTITLNKAAQLTATNGGAATFSGQITGGFGVTKIGGGTVNLTASNSYSGGTVVNAGTLKFNNTAGSATGSGSVTLNGGTLGGTGLISGAVSIGSGALLSPGNSPGIISVGSLTLASNSTFVVELLSTNSYDQANVTGTVSIDPFANLTVTNLGVSIAKDDVFTIINNDNTDLVTGQFAGFSQGLEFGYNPSGTLGYKIVYNTGSGGNDVVLIAVPEPSALALLGLGVVLLRAGRRGNPKE